MADDFTFLLEPPAQRGFNPISYGWRLALSGAPIKNIDTTLSDQGSAWLGDFTLGYAPTPGEIDTFSFSVGKLNQTSDLTSESPIHNENTYFSYTLNFGRFSRRPVWQTKEGYEVMNATSGGTSGIGWGALKTWQPARWGEPDLTDSGNTFVLQQNICPVGLELVAIPYTSVQVSGCLAMSFNHLTDPGKEATIRSSPFTFGLSLPVSIGKGDQQRPTVEAQERDFAWALDTHYFLWKLLHGYLWAKASDRMAANAAAAQGLANEVPTESAAQKDVLVMRTLSDFASAIGQGPTRKMLATAPLGAKVGGGILLAGAGILKAINLSGAGILKAINLSEPASKGGGIADLLLVKDLVVGGINQKGSPLAIYFINQGINAVLFFVGAMAESTPLLTGANAGMGGLSNTPAAAHPEVIRQSTLLNSGISFFSDGEEWTNRGTFAFYQYWENGIVSGVIFASPALSPGGGETRPANPMRDETEVLSQPDRSIASSVYAYTGYQYRAHGDKVDLELTAGIRTGVPSEFAQQPKPTAGVVAGLGLVVFGGYVAFGVQGAVDIGKRVTVEIIPHLELRANLL